MVPGNPVVFVFFTLIFIVAGCGVAEETSHIGKLKISSSTINENDIPVVYDNSETFDITWSTPLKGGHSVTVSISNSKNKPAENSHIIVEQCTGDNSTVCGVDAIITCELSSDWLLSCEDNEYTLDIADQLLDTVNEAFVHVQICNLFNNNCTRKYRRIIVASKT